MVQRVDGEIVFPARSGMNRRRSTHGTRCRCVPRPRGDEPLALAVEMAEEFGMTLIGFVKADMFKFAVGRIGSG